MCSFGSTAVALFVWNAAIEYSRDPTVQPILPRYRAVHVDLSFFLHHSSSCPGPVGYVYYEGALDNKLCNPRKKYDMFQNTSPLAPGFPYSTIQLQAPPNRTANISHPSEFRELQSLLQTFFLLLLPALHGVGFGQIIPRFRYIPTCPRCQVR
jgi:hypothetical protein